MPPDRRRDLEDELRDLGPHVEYPATPDLAGSVRGRLDAENRTPASPGRSGPSLWWIAAAALVLLVALPVLSSVVNTVGGSLSAGGGGMAGGAAQGGGGGVPGSGEQAAGGGPEAGNERTMSSAQAGQAGVASPTEATSATSSSASALAAQGSSAGSGSAERRAAGEGLGLGERIMPREARARSEAPILLPRSSRVGKPDETYDRRGAPGFTFLYRGAYPGSPYLDGTKIGLLLTQAPGNVEAAYLPGGTVEGAGLESVSVDGGEGYWIPASGDSPRVARSGGLLANVLLWERDGQALRIEADVPKEDAVRIAESVR